VSQHWQAEQNIFKKTFSFGFVSLRKGRRLWSIGVVEYASFAAFARSISRYSRNWM
jgi:hypothetical protein